MNVGGYFVLTILYSLIALAVVEALLLLWQICEPALVLKFRCLILILPPVVAAPFTLLFPDLRAALSVQDVALFESEKWLRLFGNNGVVLWLIFVLLAVIGLATFVFQMVFPVVRRHSRGGRQKEMQTWQYPRLHEVILSISDSTEGLWRTVIIDDPRPLAYVRGPWRGRIVLSNALVDALDAEELEGVLAHELAHIRRGDVWFSWCIFILRGLSFYNPVSMLAFNKISLDMERVCDHMAVSITRKPLALASALLKVYRTTAGPRGTWRWTARDRALALRLAAWQSIALQAFLQDRVKRIIGKPAGPELGYANLRLALAAAASILLMLSVT